MYPPISALVASFAAAPTRAVEPAAASGIAETPIRDGAAAVPMAAAAPGVGDCWRGCGTPAMVGANGAPKGSQSRCLAHAVYRCARVMCVTSATDQGSKTW